MGEYGDFMTYFDDNRVYDLLKRISFNCKMVLLLKDKMTEYDNEMNEINRKNIEFKKMNNNQAYDDILRGYFDFDNYDYS